MRKRDDLHAVKARLSSDTRNLSSRKQKIYPPNINKDNVTKFGNTSISYRIDIIGERNKNTLKYLLQTDEYIFSLYHFGETFL